MNKGGTNFTARFRKVPYCISIESKRFLAMSLGAIHISIGSAVDHDGRIGIFQ